VAATHGYVLIAGRPVSAFDVQGALGLSHAAVVQAFAQLQLWGLIVAGPEAPRTGRRGPRARTWAAAGDPWTWFPQVIRERKRREGDPVVAALEALLADTRTGDNEELREVQAWLADLLEFVGRFQRLMTVVAETEPQAFARTVDLLSALPDETLRRLISLGAAMEPAEANELAALVASVDPQHARRFARALRGALKFVRRR
jgi:DNA-binding transcriptional regulator GbsR (MarR family)